MTELTREPVDQAVRDRLVTDFACNFLVEAGAGSGKTHSLASRMAAGIAAGAYTVEGMAAVTFTRKAAAELRGRFRLALEARLARATTPGERERLEAALAGIERLFAGTIHAFCAHLLRERPVDAGLAPGFTELEDGENQRLQRRAWREFIDAGRARGLEPLHDLLAAGVKPGDLDQAFAQVCEHDDVLFDLGGGEPPAFDATLEAVEAFWAALKKLMPPAFHAGTKCPAQLKCDQFAGRLHHVRQHRRLAMLASLLSWWGHPGVTLKWWGQEVGRDKAFGYQARELVTQFNDAVVEPFLVTWRAYIHDRAMRVLVEARDHFRAERRRANAVNYVDLLMRTSALLREHAHVRRALQQKYRWLFVDEFQDTDPIQAEIFLLLAADEAGGDGPHGTAAAPCDPFALPLRPGALFVVGDPKQSIYRFRRADIDIYSRVRERIESTGGETLSLTANFRSRPEVCAMANGVFPALFAQYTAPHSPAFEPLAAVREAGRAGPPVATLTGPAGKTTEMLAWEAPRIAAFIAREVGAGRHRYGDFLILTRQKPRLGAYAKALDALEIPLEVSGSGLFRASHEVRALALLLAALADPLDAVSLVGVLRGPLFGLSDRELFQYRQQEGRFELNAVLPEPVDETEVAELDARFGPALSALRRLHGLWRLTRQLPLPAAVERVLEETGWLALASTTPGGAGAGHLLQALDLVRKVVEAGGGLAEAAGALSDDDTANEDEALPLCPGRRDVVRLMNLHKAKGLEAPVVILADPAHAFTFPVTLRVVRDGGGVARGHLKIVASGKERFKKDRVLGEPAGWQAIEAEEQRYCDAEQLRLLYVAATRARDCLVVCRTTAPGKNEAWGAFDGYLQGVPELADEPLEPQPLKPAFDLSHQARAAAAAARLERHERAKLPSWAVMTPTGATSRLTMPSRARRAADEGEVAGAVPETPSQRVDAGAAWGSLIHGLLEHKMRYPSATRDDLARLALWLTVESTDLRRFIPEALDVVVIVEKAPFWLAARKAGEVAVEVPFAVRLEAGEALPGAHGPGAPGAPAAATMDRPTVLRGVIDLAYEGGEGWRLADYKTDRLDGVADVDAEMQARHGAQIGQYRFAWERITGRPVTSARIVALRAIEDSTHDDPTHDGPTRS